MDAKDKRIATLERRIYFLQENNKAIREQWGEDLWKLDDALQKLNPPLDSLEDLVYRTAPIIRRVREDGVVQTVEIHFDHAVYYVEGKRIAWVNETKIWEHLNWLDEHGRLTDEILGYADFILKNLKPPYKPKNLYEIVGDRVRIYSTKQKRVRQWDTTKADELRAMGWKNWEIADKLNITQGALNAYFYQKRVTQ